jgi:hypothetical protein
MVEAAYTVIALGFVFLGVRLFIKVREISSWSSDEDTAASHSSGSKPRELLNLTIEDPSDELGSPDGLDEGEKKNNRGQ